MEYYEIELSTIGVYTYHYAFFDMFKKYNITTLGQVLDDNLMYGIMEKCRQKSRRELCSFISLMKYKYLNIPIPNDYLLDRKIATIEYTLDDTFGSLGFPELCIKDLKNQIQKQGNEILNITIKDFFKRLISQGQCRDATRKIIEIYLEASEKKNDLASNNDYDTLKELKLQLENLIKIRDDLDFEIKKFKVSLSKLEERSIGDK